jgi:8-oxo-dGTP diphosphatase
VLPDLDGSQAVVERSEVHCLHCCCEVSSPLTWHGPRAPEVQREQLDVQESGFDQLAVVPAEQCVRAEDLKQKWLTSQPDHHSALAFNWVRGIGDVETPISTVGVEVVQQGTRRRRAAGRVEATDPLPDAVLRASAAAFLRAGNELRPDVQGSAPALAAVVGLACLPAAGLHAVGVDVAGLACSEDDVAGAGPVLLAALEQLTFQEKRGPGAVVGDRQLAHLGSAGEFCHDDVRMGAGADAQLSGACRPDGKDGQRAERAADADVKLLNPHGNLLMIYRKSALTEISMRRLLLLRNPAINGSVKDSKDSSGLSLLDYPRPSVAVDAAVLTVAAGSVCVLLVRRDQGDRAGEWALPGTFLRERERLNDAVLRCLREKAGISGRVPRQLHVFDDPARDDRGWVLSVAHVDVVPLAALGEALKSDGVRLASVTDEPRVVAGLPYGHTDIVAKAVEWMRAAYAEMPDPGALLDEPFTLRDLRTLHEAVAGETLMRDTFRRFMEPKLEGTGQMSDGTRGRPSRLWVRE